MANFKRNTKYTNGIQSINRSGEKFVLLRSALKLPSDSNDTLITITQEYVLRPELISYKAYGIAELWWVILEYNNIQDPLFELQQGQILKIPSLDRVLLAIKQLGLV